MEVAAGESRRAGAPLPGARRVERERRVGDNAFGVVSGLSPLSSLLLSCQGAERDGKADMVKATMRK